MREHERLPIVKLPLSLAFIVAGEGMALTVAKARGWQRSFGNALVYENGKERVRFVADAEKLRGIPPGHKLYLGPGWSDREDRSLIDTLVEFAGFKVEAL